MAPTLSGLPLVPSLEACSDYWETAHPFFLQWNNYWQVMVESAQKGHDPLTFYTVTNPLLTALIFSFALAPIFLLVSEINKNYSQVDRCWSILPTIYIAHYTTWAHLNGLPTQKLDHILGLSVLWSTRLTYNYWRKGGYSVGSEDYRWEVIKSKISPTLMFIFNVLFISLAQSLLLFMITTPVYVFVLSSPLNGNDVTNGDRLYAGGIFACIVLSYLADQSQWNFYNARTAYRKTAKVPKNSGYTQRNLDLGFNHCGLFAYSRHPNFAAEQAVWVTLWSWSCYNTKVWANWTAIGAVSYLILFQASTWFTELVTLGKYPEYAEYQKRVSKFLPKIQTFFTGPLPEVFMNEKKVPQAAAAAATESGKKK